MYVPYPQVQFLWNPSRGFTVSSPWLTLRCESSDALKPVILRLGEFSTTRRCDSLDDASIQRFLSTLMTYPLVFDVDSPAIDPSVSSLFDRTGAVRAVSAYSVLRYLRSEKIVSQVRAERLYELLNETPEIENPKYVENIAQVIRQTHFVTSMCDSSIEPACRKPGPWQVIIEDFRNSEKNHDKLMRQSLAGLGFLDPEKKPVFNSTRQMMDLLREAAEESLFAFSVCVEAFEGGVQKTGSGLLGKALEKDERTKDAAKGLLWHDQINRKGRHHSVGLDIARSLPPVSRGEFDWAQEQMLQILACQEKLIDDSIELFRSV